MQINLHRFVFDFIMKSKIFLNFFILNIEKFFSIISGIIVSGVLARALGSQNYGDFQYLLSLVAIFSAISFFCGAEVLLPRLVENKKSEEECYILNAAFLIRITAGFFAAILFFVFYFFNNGWTVGLIFCVVICLKEALCISIVWFQSESLNRVCAYVFLLFNALKLLSISALYYFEVYSISVYIFIYAFDMLVPVVVIFYLFILKSNFNINLFISDKNSHLIKIFLFQSFPFFVGVVAMIFFKKMDKILIKNVISEAEYSMYVVASQIYENFSFVGVLVLTVLGPALVYSKKNLNEVELGVSKIIKFQFLLYILICLFCYFFMSDFINIVFGREYANSISYIYLFVCLIFLVVIDESISMLYLKYKKGNIFFLKWVIMVIVFILFYFILFKNYFANGLIFSYFGAYSFILAFHYFLIKIKKVLDF